MHHVNVDSAASIRRVEVSTVNGHVCVGIGARDAQGEGSGLVHNSGQKGQCTGKCYQKQPL